MKSLSDEFENIYYIEGERRGGYPYSNSLLIGDYLIDTGISSGRIRKLNRNLLKLFLTLFKLNAPKYYYDRIICNCKWDKNLLRD